MKVTLQKTLNPDEIKSLSSIYLDAGVKQEFWQIVSIEINGPVLEASLRMTSTSASPTDNAGFHLTIFSTMEFLSQLANIYFHVWAGYQKKTREVWMREYRIKCKQPIRDAQNISARLEVISLKQVGEQAFGLIHFEVSDPAGGCFQGKLKGVLT